MEPARIAARRSKPHLPKAKQKSGDARTGDARTGDTRTGGAGARGRKLRAVALVLAGAAVLSAVFVGGWATANRLAVAGQDRPSLEPAVVMMPENVMSGSARMPDVRGLGEADALQAIVDAGISASIISTDERPAAGAAGRVVQQMPVFGTLDPGSVSIVISTEADVPKVAGRPAAEAIDELQQLGARVVQTRIYEPGAEVGDAVRTEPSAGKPLHDTVTLFIADTPGEKPLGDFDTVDGWLSTSNETLFGGVAYDSMISFSADEAQYVDDYAIKLDAKVTSITGKYAIAEDQEAAFSGTFIVLGDGKEIARARVRSTTPESFEWDVRGVRTLVIRAVRADPDEWGDLVLLDPVALGGFDDLAEQP